MLLATGQDNPPGLFGRYRGRHWDRLDDDTLILEDNEYDVATGRFVLNGADLGPRVVAAYRRAEQARRDRLAKFLTRRAIPHATIAGSDDIRRELVGLTEVAGRAG